MPRITRRRGSESERARGPGPERPGPRSDRLLGRATFLGVIGAGVAGIAWGREASSFAGRFVPDEVEEILPSKGWRIFTIRGVPHVDVETYRLEVSGLVERPLSLSLDDLRSLPQVEQVSDFHCVSGWSVHNVHWRGVRFDDVLAEAGLRPEAAWLGFVSAETPYVDTLSLKQARFPDAMLALELDGKPLSRPHGFPARVVMPQMYGYKSVKWLTRIEARRNFIPGYWERRGYDSNAWVGRSNFKHVQGLE